MKDSIDMAAVSSSTKKCIDSLGIKDMLKSTLIMIMVALLVGIILNWIL